MDVIGTDVTSRCHSNRYISIKRHNTASLLVLQQPNFSLYDLQLQSHCRIWHRVFWWDGINFSAHRTAGIFRLLQRFRDKLRFLYGLQETFPSARTAMPVPVPSEPRAQSTGVLSWTEGDRDVKLTLTPVYLLRLRVSAAVPLLLPACFHGVDSTQLYLFTYIPGNVSTFFQQPLQSHLLSYSFCMAVKCGFKKHERRKEAIQSAV